MTSKRWVTLWVGTMAGCAASDAEPSGTTEAPASTGAASDGTGDAGNADDAEPETTMPPGNDDPSTGSTASSMDGSDDATGPDASTGADDTGGVPATCDPFAQDCPPGYKCSAYAEGGSDTWNANACFPIARDPAGVGEPCRAPNGATGGVDTCALGAMCWDTDAQGMGTCVALCEGTLEQPTCSVEGTSCALSNENVLNLCLDGCDPLAQHCAPGNGCYPVTLEDFQCLPTIPGAQSQVCTGTNGCDAGLACVGAELFPSCGSDFCCSMFCDLDLGNACAGPLGPGWNCLSWFELGAAPAGMEDLGVCIFI
jgi:hypothetical protein